MKKIGEIERMKNNIRSKLWYAENKEKKKQYDKEHRKLNSTRIAAERKIHYEQCKEREQSIQKIYGIKPEARYKRAVRNSKKRGKTWDISQQDYIDLISQPCFYDGASLCKEFGTGLDRIDNSKGYSLDNVVPCCGDCNIIRGDRLTHEEMEVAMQAVLNFRRRT